MKIVCVGGGPAGLYFAISMKLRDPAHEVLVLERNRPDDTFGWGVVLSDDVLSCMEENDRESAEAIRAEFAHWDDVTVHYRGTQMTSGGHGFSGIGRRRLLNILQARAAALGVEVRYECEVDPATLEADYPDADLIIASDGINSRVRAHHAESFKPDVELRPNKFVWLGTHQSFNDAFTFLFEKTEHGWIWAHCYQFDSETSTFIVECSEETWKNFGFDKTDTDGTIKICEELFGKYLGGNRLMSNAAHLRGSAWLNFPRVACEKWSHGRIILMGDAAHTAHYSIGSGTRLAVEDAMDLAALLHDGSPREEALKTYEETRRLEVLRLQSAARNSMTWFEDLERYLGQPPEQFMYALLTRSQRVSHENLRLRDAKWLESMEDWFADRAFAAAGRQRKKRTPPMLTPFKLRDMTLENRVVVSPMCTYSATDGLVGDWHLVHYGARAQGGAGLVMTEMTDISADARITPGCAGIYTDEQTAAWKRIVDFVHAHSGAKMGIQLGHAGVKGATKLLWEGYDEPLDEGGWPLIGPSDVPWTPQNQTPRPMTRADMDRVLADYVRAAGRADEAGFDLLELHCAHGYLLSAFITPLLNRRTDAYGGSLENRLRYPLEVFAALRAAWPERKPMSVRLSATDWMGDMGVTPEESATIAAAFRDAGVDIVDVSAGQTSPDAQPVYGRMFQTPFSDRIRNEADVATMAVGNIYETDHVNSIIMAGRADLCCLARPHLANPYWTLHARAGLGFGPARWPVQYLAGKQQLERNIAKAAEMAIVV